MNEIFVAFWWIYFCIFFSNYIIVYAISHLLAKNKNWNTFIIAKIYPLLPLAYAFVTTCFWTIFLYQYSFNYIWKTIMAEIPAKLIIIWSLLSLLFWLPVFRKKNYFSLLHSIPFFILPLISIGNNIFKFGLLEWDDVWNLLRIYIAGLLIYVAAIIILLVAKFLILCLASPKRHAV